jgi:hypothetical protein
VLLDDATISICGSEIGLNRVFAWIPENCVPQKIIVPAFVQFLLAHIEQFGRW